MRYFGVDLNDLVDFGQLALQQGHQDRGIQRMAVQTSYDNQSFTTVGAWPQQLNAWDGSVQISAIPVPSGLALGDHAMMSSYFEVLATDPRFGAVSLAPSTDHFGLAWSDFKDV